MKKNWKRTHTCGELSSKNAGETAALNGWVAKRRDHGGLIFIDLRDRYGITQVVVDPANGGDLLAKTSALKGEYVVAFRGKVRLRPDTMVNPKLATGEIELEAQDLELLSEAKTPPFLIEDGVDAGESLRLKYRYLDLRRPELQKNLMVRHRFCQVTRNYLAHQNFIEVETPILFKSTPEGARDYLVPSRVNPGQFYALPQSPQILKQLLMVAGMDRYYQIARCFRDEDLRADRQPEFSQIDIEMSFCDEESIYTLCEGLIREAYADILDVELPKHFPRMTYDRAMEDYGIDKPDTRFGMKLVELTPIFQATNFQAFRAAVSTGAIKGILVEGVAEGDNAFSRKTFDDLTKFAQNYGAKGLAWFKVGAELELQSPIAKFLSPEELTGIAKSMHAKNGDVILVVADPAREVAQTALGNVRAKLGHDLSLIDEGAFHFLWVTDFPLLEYSPDDKRWIAKHHPFTMPATNDVDSLLKGERLGELKAAAYDLVCNGYEVAGGSLRIYRQEVQEAMFRVLQLSEEDIKQRFGFFVEALQYGTPPHGGIAFGLDRNVMLLCGTDAIRDVIAYPKTQKASCLMSECPSPVTVEQLTELSISVLKKGNIST
jgi:aspartyl-tRNA synthetase